MDRVIAPVEVPPDTAWVKRVKIQSKLLTDFWGRPFYLGATVLLPKDYDRNPEERYPVIYIQGHFGLGAPFGFTDQAADSSRRQAGSRFRPAVDVRRFSAHGDRHLPAPHTVF